MLDALSRTRAMLQDALPVPCRREEIMRLLEKGHIPVSQGMVMTEILVSLASGKFKDLVAGMQVAFLKSMQDLFRKPNGRRLGAMCFLFYGEDPPPGDAGVLIPAGLLEAMISAARSATSQEVKERIWDFLLRPGIHVEKIAAPEDFADAMFSTDALLRNRVILFLLEKYSPEMIMRTLSGCVRAERPIPGAALKRIRDFAPTLLLTLVENASGRNRATLEQLFSEPILGLNRFDYIRVRTVGCGKKDDASTNGGFQMSLSLKPARDPQPFAGFRTRASLIRDGMAALHWQRSA